MQTIERAIIGHFLASALNAGFYVRYVDDGETRTPMRNTHPGTVAAVLDVVDSVDESRILFGRTASPTALGETLVIILGNGVDCISDMSCGRGDWDALCEAEAQWADRGADVILDEVIAQRDAQIDALRSTAADALARLANLQKLAVAYDERMTAQDRSPTGHDYNALFEAVAGA